MDAKCWAEAKLDRPPLCESNSTFQTQPPFLGLSGRWSLLDEPGFINTLRTKPSSRDGHIARNKIHVGGGDEEEAEVPSAGRRVSWIRPLLC